MTKPKTLIFYIWILLSFSVNSQENALWKKVSRELPKNEIIGSDISISHFKTYELQYETLNATFKGSSSNIEFPDAHGKMEHFSFKKSNVMHPELAKKFSGIATYTGTSVLNPNRQVYFSKSHMGLHAMIVEAGKSTLYIDPYNNSRKVYRVYQKSEVTPRSGNTCLTEEGLIEKKSSLFQKGANDLTLRTFRLAIATTEEYATYHVNLAGLGAGSTRQDSINVVMSSIVAAITRVNAIYERDLAISMQLVPNNEQLIFLASDPGSDPYTNNDGSAMLDQNQTTINSIIGFSNYDIGHVFSTGGGGVAYLRSVCTTSKAKGVTGLDDPIGDPYYIDYVAHEMGHQYGANHTFNGADENCAGTRNNVTAVEPGSGSTIMAYAGICSPNDVQSSSDSYFHVVSIQEIHLNVTTGSSQCAVQTSFLTNANVPVVDAGTNYTIPKSTAFVLTGNGTDLDNDELSYCWEQIDNEVTNINVPPSTTQTVGAVFRSLPPSKSRRRYLPNLPTVISGSLSSTWEVTPSVSRDLNFALTVRDNVPGEGQSASDITTISVTDIAGPFVVTSQNMDGIVWQEGTNETITWDVAGTDGNGVNVSHVNILLSTNGGVTFDVILASNTPNDGSETILVPAEASGTVRVLVEAVDNIFYAVNSHTFAIGSYETTCTDYTPLDLPLNIPDNNATGVVSTLEILDDFAITDVNVHIELAHSWLWDLQIYLIAPSGTEVLIYDRSCGGSSENREDINATFDDAAPEKICENTIPAIHDSTKPDNLLSLLNGESSFGEWQLKIVDNAGGDVGVLNNWNLNLCRTESTVSVGESNFEKFKIYPNPFDDMVTITFQPTTPESVELSLYDLQGRMVLSKTYGNTQALFKEVINLSKLSSGMYVLRLQMGNQSANSKIIKY